MATKQVQNFEEYFESLSYYQQSYFSSGLYVIAKGIRANGSPFYGRIQLGATFDSFVKDYGVLTKSNCEKLFDEKYLAITKDGYVVSSSIDILSSNDLTRGVQFPTGIQFNDSQETTSWIGWGVVEPSNYGDQVNATTEANVCQGTFGMDTVYIKDLYVKNLHTAESSSSSSGDYLPKETYTDKLNFTGIGITVDRIKSSGQCTRGVAFTDGISLCEKDITDSWIGYWQVNPTDYGFTDNTDIPSNVCYGTFGMETVYVSDLWVRNLHTPDFDLKDKIKRLEARIAALEAK